MYIILYIDCCYSLCDFDLVFKLDDSTKNTIKLSRIFKVYSVNVLNYYHFKTLTKPLQKSLPLWVSLYRLDEKVKQIYGRNFAFIDIK